MGGAVPGFRAVAVLAAAFWLACVGAGLAQDSGIAPAPDLSGKVLVLDQDRLFQLSRFGQASIARSNETARQLEAENARILAGLIAEEQSLTTQRTTLPSEEFSQLAEAFDAKAERIRREQDAKLSALVAARDADRAAFLGTVGPVLVALLRETGASAIIDASAVVLFSPDFDITDEAILRVDRELSALPAPPADPATPPVPGAEP